MRPTGLIVALPLLLAAVPSQADDCKNAISQNEMNRCAAEAYARADAELNRVYRKTIAGMDEHSLLLLKNSQRDWIKFRDDECLYESVENEGGSIYPMEYNGCLTTLTKARTTQLKAGQN